MKPTISSATPNVCATQLSASRVCLLALGLSKPAAKPLSAQGSNSPGCSGPSKEPTLSSHCVAANSVLISKTTGLHGHKLPEGRRSRDGPVLPPVHHQSAGPSGSFEDLRHR